MDPIWRNILQMAIETWYVLFYGAEPQELQYVFESVRQSENKFIVSRHKTKERCWYQELSLERGDTIWDEGE